MEARITSIDRRQLVSKKTGKPFTSVRITTDKHGDKQLSGFASVENADWNVGDTVNIEVEQKGNYLNFKTPKEETVQTPSSPSNAEIKNMLTFKVIPMLQAILDTLPKKESAYPPFDEENQPPF